MQRDRDYFRRRSDHEYELRVGAKKMDAMSAKLDGLDRSAIPVG